MARRGESGYKSKTRNKVKLGGRGSDDSDEDYIVCKPEDFVGSEDEYCSSLADDESLGEFKEEELEEERMEKKIKKVRRPRGPENFRERKNEGGVKPRKRSTVDSEEEEEDYDDDDYVGTKRTKKSMLPHTERKDGLGEEKPRKRSQVWGTEKHVDFNNQKPAQKTKFSYQEEGGDDNDSDDDDDDEEFTPDDLDCLDDDDEDLHIAKKNKVDGLRMQKGRVARGKERKRNAEALKRTQRRKPKKKQNSRRKDRYHGKEIKNESPIVQKKKKITRKGRKKPRLSSDSGIVSSGLSGNEYTMSEEEREQVKERKGKEKVLDMKTEIGKQVCGICLSEEGNRTVRGTLNCCSHYFCFSCIMEWSKVESRCPLCKQRFATISRTARTDDGHDLRDAVITVPEHDQVYQPSEEELRGFLDPYEDVICTECHQGWDDALMLLCDLCDSPAHTYCVGLGHEVPEGNWYCGGCRPPTPASSHPQATNPTFNNGANNNCSVGSSPVGPVRGNFDLNELCAPETPLSRVNLASHRNSFGYSQAASPTSGTWVFTLYERRRLQRHIYELLNYRSRELGRSDGATLLSGIGLFGSQNFREAVVVPQHAVPVRRPPQNIYHQGGLLDRSAPPLYGREILPQRLSSFRGQVPYQCASTSTDHSFGGISHTDFSGTPTGICQDLRHQQMHPFNIRSSTGAVDASILPYQFREVSLSSIEKEQVQCMVKSHLRSLSRNMHLEYTSFKHIARASTHTVLAAVGLVHRGNEVYPVQSRPLICNHFDRRCCCFDTFVRDVVKEIMSTI